MTLNDIFTDWTIKGIFTTIKENNPTTEMPWNIQENLLDIYYHGNFSNKKVTSTLIDNLIESGKTITEIINYCSSIIFNTYSDVWKKRYNTLNFNYDPIENYNMAESSSRDITDNDVIENTNSMMKNTTNTMSKGETITTNGETTANQNGDIYGFNSTAPTPTDKQTAINTGENTETHSGQDVNAITGTDTDTYSGTNKKTFSENLKHERSGNIGVTTTQQMIEQERNILLWNYYHTLFIDCDNILTSNFYEN